MTETLVDLRNLDVGFDTLEGFRPVLKGVDLVIRPGEMVGLVGETGSGKSVTAKYLLGILPMPPARITGGSASLFGKDLLTIAPAERAALKRYVAYVPQDPMAALNPSFTIGSQMIDIITWDRCGRSLPRYFLQRHTPSLRRSAREHARLLLDKVHINNVDDVLRCYPVQLSGGMRQRVLLALAMSGSPRLLIADEPTTALDVTVQKKTVELIQELVDREKLAGLYITHDLGVARWICDRTSVMLNGEIVEEGPTETILGAPKHPYTRRLVDAVPRLDAAPVSVSPISTTGVPRLRVRDLVKIYGKHRAVDGVSFDVRPGEIFAIVGESGSGKSTIAQILSGINSATSGSIEFDGAAIGTSPAARDTKLRGDIQMVFQDPGSALNPRQTIERIIGLPLRLHGRLNRRERRERIAQLLRQVALPPEIMRRKPGSLSGGQKQRVTIARALALEPKLLILDEPTSALDVSVQAKVIALLDDLRRNNDLTYILITHDLGVVRALADRVAVMHRGVIIECDTADAVLVSPQTEYTRDLIAAVPVLDVLAPAETARVEQAS